MARRNEIALQDERKKYEAHMKKKDDALARQLATIKNLREYIKELKEAARLETNFLNHRLTAALKEKQRKHIKRINRMTEEQIAAAAAEIAHSSKMILEEKIERLTKEIEIEKSSAAECMEQLKEENSALARKLKTMRSALINAKHRTSDLEYSLSSEQAKIKRLNDVIADMETKHENAISQLCKESDHTQSEKSKKETRGPESANEATTDSPDVMFPGTNDNGRGYTRQKTQ